MPMPEPLIAFDQSRRARRLSAVRADLDSARAEVDYLFNEGNPKDAEDAISWAISRMKTASDTLRDIKAEFV
jgi:hypothetical protein